MCFTLYFVYVTETGKSWAGPIENARFRFINTDFEKDLRHFPDALSRAEAEHSPETDPPDESSNESDSMGFVRGMRFGTFYAHFAPDGWKAASRVDAALSSGGADGIGWEFENFKPGEPLLFEYYFLNFPQTPAECDSWVRLVLGKSPAKGDILELREVLAAFFGVPSQSDAVRRIVEKEVWYNAKSKLSESQLSEAQRAVLSRLSQIADPHNGAPMKTAPSANRK